jgi:hypothetical protein
MTCKRVMANYWIESTGESWRIMYENTGMKLFYCLGQLWTTDVRGAKIFKSSDEAVLALTDIVTVMMDN